MIEVVLVLVAAGFMAFGVVIGRKGAKAPQSAPMTPKPEPPPPPPPVVNVDLSPIRKDIQEMPNKVLQSIQNCSNTHKGALGELIGYIRLQAQYDRIIPLGDIVDFVCIKLPSDSQEGTVDFVDVKTGKNARLSKEQRALRDLIKNKSIDFVEVKIKELSEAPSQRH